MNIALVSLQFEETATGGGGVHVKSICEQFLKHGHSVTLLSIHSEKTLDSADLLNEWYVPYSIQDRGRLSIIRFLIDKGISHPYEGDKDIELDRIQRFADVVIRWLKTRQDEFDVVNLHGHHIIPGLIAKKLQGSRPKIVSTVHALESTYISKKGESLARFKASDKLLILLRKWESMCRFSDFIILNSPVACNDFKEILDTQNVDFNKFESKIKLISSGCNENFLMSDRKISRKLSRIPDKINLITFSRIDPSKGIEYSISGAKSAARKCPHKLCLTIAGIAESNAYLSKIRSEMENHPENLTIKLKQFNAISPPSEKKEILDDKHIYILPTLKEPFGMSLIEASARGNMLVSTDNTGPRYMIESDQTADFDWGVVTQYGILAKITEDHKKTLPKNIGSAIVWAIENWKYCSQKTLAFNKKIRQKWTWEEIARQYLELFRGV